MANDINVYESMTKTDRRSAGRVRSKLIKIAFLVVFCAASIVQGKLICCVIDFLLDYFQKLTKSKYIKECMRLTLSAY